MKWLFAAKKACLLGLEEYLGDLLAAYWSPISMSPWKCVCFRYKSHTAMIARLEWQENSRQILGCNLAGFKHIDISLAICFKQAYTVNVTGETMVLKKKFPSKGKDLPSMNLKKLGK